MQPLPVVMPRLARYFKVSTLVVLQRLRDAGRIDNDSFRLEYAQERQRLIELQRRSAGGGDFDLTTAARYSKRFSRALIESTIEGRTLYSEAFRLFGISRTTDVPTELGRTLGSAV